MGLSKFFILRVLYSRPRHGYEIIQTVAKISKGCCTPTEGTIYPALREFEAAGLVTCRTESTGGRERKVYFLTARGKRAFEVAAEAWKEATHYILEAVEIPELQDETTF
mgnify:CR=1 FL=1